MNSDDIQLLLENYELIVIDNFEMSNLNTDLWLPYYLPHWSSQKRSKPNYGIRENCLILKISEDHEPWCPEFDGNVKVSSIQTGQFSGPLNSNIGQHRFNKDCVVREEQDVRKLFTPTYGYFEVKVKTRISRNNLVSLWMIGFEEKPNESAEICIFEIFGKSVDDGNTEIGYGLHPFGDATITDEFYRETFDINPNEFQVFGCNWTENFIDLYINNSHTRRILQSPDYPMQFMLGIYEFDNEEQETGDYPKEFVIDYFKAFQKEN